MGNIVDTGIGEVVMATVEGSEIQYSHYSFSSDNPYAGGCAWIEGKYVPTANARISIFDAGFGHSDVTYTVASVWHGNIFRLDEHVERFLEGAKKMRLYSPLNKSDIIEIMKECVARSELREAYVNVSLTRGFGHKPGEKDPNALTSQIYAYAIPYLWVFNPFEQISGISAVIARDVKRSAVNNIDPSVKNYQWGDLTRAMFEAEERGARTPFLLDADDFLTEGPGFNIFIIKDRCLFTPVRNVLPGITRKTAIEIAVTLGLEIRVSDISVEMLRSADEIFTSTTAGGITPVISLDGQAIGAGKPGELTCIIRSQYWALMDQPSSLIEPINYK